MTSIGNYKLYTMNEILSGVLPEDLEANSDAFSDFTKKLINYSDRIRFAHTEEMFLNNNNDNHVYHIDLDRGFIVFPVPYLSVKLEHQFAHFVEMNNLERLKLPSYGMRGFWGDIPSAKGVIAALSRESRVDAIETVMSENGRHSKTSGQYGTRWKRHGYAMRSKLSFPMGRFKNEADIVSWGQDIYGKTMNHWSLDKIESEFKSRIDFLTQWMDSNSSIKIAA